MSLSKLGAASGGFIERSLNTQMTRREFLQMGGALLLTLLGFQNLMAVFMKHTKNTSPVPLMGTNTDGFGTRKFGQ